MPSCPSFHLLLSRHDGNSAAAYVVERYASRLAVLDAGKMSGWLKQRVGTEDVVQPDLATFFGHHAEGHLELCD